MAITLHLYYKGENGKAKQFMEEMEQSGTVAAIRAEKGNLKYDYFFPVSDPETVLLIDSWENQAAIDAHHASPMVATVIALRDKYDQQMMFSFATSHLPFSNGKVDYCPLMRYDRRKRREKLCQHLQNISHPSWLKKLSNTLKQRMNSSFSSDVQRVLTAAVLNQN